jgi:hypothetical protein
LPLSNTYSIRLRHQWWIDAGIVGLYSIALQLLPRNPQLDLSISDDGTQLLFHYDQLDSLRIFFQNCYEELARRHWNVSTKKQRENPEWVIYDRKTDTFHLKPKRNPTPIPALFVKGSSWRPDGISLDELEKEQPELAHRTRQYLAENKKTLWGSKKLLLYDSPVCHAELTILPNEKKKKTVCSVCGQESPECEEVSQPAFLLFASSSAAKSFNSNLKNPDKLCWECNFLSRFAVESALYRKIRDNKLFILQIISPNINKLIRLQGTLGVQSHMRQLDEEYFMGNIGMSSSSLLHSSYKPYEFLWAFFSEAYLWLEENRGRGLETNLFLELLNISLDQAPLQLGLFMLSTKGQTFLVDDLIFYNDSAYLFRLLYELRHGEQTLDLRSMYFDLFDRTNKENPTGWRNRIFKRVLNKKLIIKEVEQFAFHVSREGTHPNLNHILQFTIAYESLLRDSYQINSSKEDTMNSEQIKIATQLGRQIVYSAKEYLCGEDPRKKDELKKIKGDLFTLRKTRTIPDFMNQINTFQMRYGIVVSRDYVEGVLETCDFEHFKAYVVTSALNAYNSLMYHSQKEKGEEVQ